MEKITSETRFLRDKGVAEMLSISRTQVWKLSKQGKLPKPIKLSPGVTIWEYTGILKSVETPNSISNDGRCGYGR